MCKDSSAHVASRNVTSASPPLECCCGSITAEFAGSSFAMDACSGSLSKTHREEVTEARMMEENLCRQFAVGA